MYKLTDAGLRTMNGYQWVPMEWHLEPGNTEICLEGWLHCYNDPLLAFFLNPAHAKIPFPRLWECEVIDPEPGIKVACRGMRIIRELKTPHIDQEHRIRMALLVSLEVCSNPQYRAWADAILNGGAYRLRTRGDSRESDEEIIVRNLAYKCAMYEEVEMNCALTIIEADKNWSLDWSNLAEQAYGQKFVVEPLC